MAKEVLAIHYRFLLESFVAQIGNGSWPNILSDGRIKELTDAMEEYDNHLVSQIEQ